MSQIQKSIIAIILLKRTFEEQKAILDQLIPEFFEDKNKEVFIKMKEKAEDGVLLDIQNIWGKEGDYITQCIQTTAIVSSLESAFLELQKEYTKREYSNLAHLDNPQEIKSKIAGIELNASLLSLDKSKEITDVLSSDIIEQSKNEIDLENLPKTGFLEFDEFYEGFMPQNLITVGGYSGVGKSTFIFSLIKNLAFQHPTLIFNLEMSNSMMSARILSALSGVPYIYTCNLGNNKTQGKIDKFNFRERLTKGIASLDNINLKMSDNEFRLDRILTRIRNEANRLSTIDNSF